MANSSGRIAAGLVILSAVWIGVYWWWPVEPPIRFATTDETSQASRSNISQRQVASPIREHARTTPAGSTLANAPTPPPMQLTGVPGVVAPSFIDDTIRAGDTFASIAQRHYGDASRADVIARANPLMSPLNLREGRTIRVPNDPANVQGLPVVKLADGSTQTAPAQQPANAAPAQEYVVQKGDSLARIAKRVFGEERLADMIFQANRDVLSDPSKIRVGQKLKIPPKPVTDIAAAGDGT